MVLRGLEGGGDVGCVQKQAPDWKLQGGGRTYIVVDVVGEGGITVGWEGGRRGCGGGGVVGWGVTWCHRVWRCDFLLVEG